MKDFDSIEYTDTISSEEIISSKRIDDDNYDIGFDLALEDRYFDTGELPFVEPLYVFCDEFNAIYKYYEYSYRHINRLLEEQKEKIDGYLESDDSAEAADVLGDLQIAGQKYLLDVNHQGVLLMLYTVFENMLSGLVDYECEELNYMFYEDDYYGAKINKYIYFLRNTCRIEFPYDRMTKDRVSLMRETRNYYVHDTHGDGAELLDKYSRVSPKPLLADGKLVITRDYVLSCFELIGQIAKDISAEFDR